MPAVSLVCKHNRPIVHAIGCTCAFHALRSQNVCCAKAFWESSARQKIYIMLILHWSLRMFNGEALSSSKQLDCGESVFALNWLNSSSRSPTCRVDTTLLMFPCSSLPLTVTQQLLLKIKNHCCVSAARVSVNDSVFFSNLPFYPQFPIVSMMKDLSFWGCSYFKLPFFFPTWKSRGNDLV